MKTAKYYPVIVVVVVILCALAVGQVEEVARLDLIAPANPTLGGIEKLYVVIMPLDAESNKEGLVWQQLQAKIEQKLSEAGIKVVSTPVFDTGLKAYDIPEFRVYIDMLKLSDSQQYVFRIQTSLSKAVYLTEKRELLLKADVWRLAPAMQAASAETLADAVTKVVCEQVEVFSSAYLAANPPGAQTTEAQKTGTVSPGTTKKQAESQTAKLQYVASRNSRVFHKAGCSFTRTIKPENIVSYNSKDEAINAGKRPCKRCSP